MPRQPRQLHAGCSYHITTRCNNREFRLARCYIHANPKAAGIQPGFFYDFSNYGTYDRLTQDGITQWHPAFLALGATLEICAAAYRKFCKRYKPKPKAECKNHWGSKLLKSLALKPKKQKTSPGQMNLWEEWEVSTEIHRVAERFVVANCFNPRIALALFPQPPTIPH